MARSKAKRARARGKSKPAAKKAAPKPARAPRPKSANREVELRWKEYWKCRKDLEEAVVRVKTARENLDGAMETEQRKRQEFDEIRRSLTQLLDVEPAGPKLLTENASPSE